ncbi:MAG TPA: rhodanese-like domain-containing protein [Candidatus Thermoplasmatota archaeon]|nr:rhodanese-like domain-containing protein [Candidatus Thermoplasmatota archaeon]
MFPRRPGHPNVPEVAPEEAKALAEKGALMVDVREQDEWDEVRIPGAVHVPLMTLPSRLAELPKDRPLVMQCHLGGRSLQAAVFLQRNGFTDVRNLSGGIARWEDEGLPVERA